MDLKPLPPGGDGPAPPKAAVKTLAGSVREGDAVLAPDDTIGRAHAIIPDDPEFAGETSILITYEDCCRATGGAADALPGLPL